MTTKHTPGPWSTWHFSARAIAVGPDAGGLAVAEIVTTNAHGIATAETEERGAANANLIAAAPDLLRVLEFIAADLNSTLDAEAALLVQNAINRAKLGD